MVAFVIMNPYSYNLSPGANQQVANLWPFLGAVLGGAAIGAGIAEVTGGEWEEGALYGAAGGGILGGAGGIFGAGKAAVPVTVGAAEVSSGGGILSGIGGLFGQAAVPVMTGGEMGSLAQASAAPGLFSTLSLDTLANVAQVGYGVYLTHEQMELQEKAIEAQARLGYVVSAPGAPTTTLAPTTAITIPRAAAAVEPAGLFAGEQGEKIVKYGAVIIIGYFVFKALK